jgi:hypothetical protein
MTVDGSAAIIWDIACVMARGCMRASVSSDECR